VPTPSLDNIIKRATSTLTPTPRYDSRGRKRAASSTLASSVKREKSTSTTSLITISDRLVQTLQEGNEEFALLRTV